MNDINLLMVDHEEAILSYFRRVFRSEYKVYTSSTIDDAVNYLSMSEFHVAIVDSLFTNKKDGFDFLKTLKNYQPLCQIIVMSACPSKEEVTNLKLYKPLTYLEKPTVKKILFKHVRQGVDNYIKAKKPLSQCSGF